MAEYTNDLRLKEIATGDESGTWGTSTNTNLELIAEAFSFSSVATFDTDADKTETIADGSTDPYRSIYVKVTSGVSLTATRTLTIAPNTVSKIFMIENATSGAQSIAISQGSGANVTIPNGDVKVIYTDGAGAGAAVADAFANLKVTDPAQTNITSVGALDGGSITSGFGSIDVGSSAITTTGTVTGSTLAGTLSTAAQTNITSVGTLADLTVTGDLTVDTDTLFVDASADSVGIGTDSPSNILDVQTSTTTTGLRFQHTANDNNTAGIFVQNDTSDVLRMRVTRSGAGGVSLLEASNSLEVKTGGSLGLAIDSSQNVGIGTNTPDTLLHLEASNNGVTTPTSANNRLRFTDTDTSVAATQPAGTIEFETRDSNAPGINAFISSVYANTAGGMELVFGTGFGGSSSEQMRITDGGDVGIGTTNPSTLLELSANNEGGSNNTLRLTDTDTNVAGTQSIGALEFYGSDTSGAGAGVKAKVQAESVSNEGASYLYFTTSDTSTNNQERMRIDSSGNVGIGTTNPNANLEVANGSDAAALILNANSTSQGATSRIQSIRGDFTGTTSAMAFSTNDGTSLVERMRINTSGNVGIGTNTPDTILEVRGADPILTIRDTDTSTTTGNSTIRFAESGASDTLGEYWDVGLQPISALAFSRLGTEHMRITSTGNVGIGYTSIASYKFAVNGTMYVNNGIYLPDGSAASPILTFDSDSNTGLFRATTDTLGFSTAGTERMRIDSSGNLLVGTTDTTLYNNGAGGNTGILLRGDVGNIQAARSGGAPIDLNRLDSDGDIAVFAKDGSTVGNISVTGSATAYNTSSDARLKDITGEARGLAVINALNPVAYNWKADGKADEGLVAQEVLELVPNAVTGSEEDYYQMDYSKLVVHLIKGMQEQQEQIESLKSEIELLKGGN